MYSRISEYSKLESHLRKNLLVEEEPINFTYNENDSDNDKGVLHGDDSTTLVIKKSLLTLKGDSDKDLRHNNNFCSTCTIKDKDYSLIIDSKNCKNMVFMEVVKKL